MITCMVAIASNRLYSGAMQTWGTPELVPIAETSRARGGTSKAREGNGEGGVQDKKSKNLP